MPVRTVLVVDDDPVIVNLLRVNFEIEGYEVLDASKGEEALAKAESRLPELVVLDVMMPGMDGIEVATRLRGQPATSTIPIILLSAKAQSGDVEAGLAVADDYVTKPFEPLELLNRATALLDGAPGGRSG